MGETFVTENVLSRSIAQLRRALGDDAKEARYIETVPTRGYRFVAELSEDGAGANQSAVPRGRETAVPLETAPLVPIEHPVRPRQVLRHGYLLFSLALVVCLGAAATYLIRSRSTLQHVQVASATQITSSHGIAFCPTFSPDNTEIAYSTDRGQGFEIFRRSLTSGAKELQITSDEGQNVQPAWSPDGKLIAYFSKVRGGIWLVPALGGTPRRLTDFGSHPAWSRDAQWIAFQSSVLEDVAADNMGVALPSMIWKIRADGTDAGQITHPGVPEGGLGAPSWSPDSAHITFISTRPNAVWSIGADGKGLEKLADSGYRYYDPIYSPDGKSVFFGAVAVAGGDVSIYGLSQVRVSPEISAPLEKPVAVFNSSGFHVKNLSFSADGKKIVYAALNMTSSLQSLQVSSSGESAGESPSLASETGCRLGLEAFSPDGSHIAYQSCFGRAGSPTQIWLMDKDGHEARQLTLGPQGSGSPMWNPDGRHILFFSSTEGKKLLSVNIETLQQAPAMTISIPLSTGALSPDGTQLAIGSQANGVLNTWVMDIASGKLKKLTFEKEEAAYPSWSPDGKFIAVEVRRGADNSIMILPSAGGPMTQLTPYEGEQWSDGWSPDGDKVLFAKQEGDGSWNIWWVSRSTKIEKQLTHYTNRNAFVRYPVMSPRGNQIVYERTETTGNIWMLQLK
jgi:Tol biopolymer transport system component